MTHAPPRAVYDCAVFVQGLGRRNSVSRKCLDYADAGTVQLCLSPATLAEIYDVLNRPEILRKFPLIESTSSRQLLAALMPKALTVAQVPNAFRLPRDTDDPPYTDLAIAADASYLVTLNDRHLTYLMRQDTPEGIDFCRRFPQLKILTPPEFVRQIEPTP